MSVEALWSVEFISSNQLVGTGVAVLETQRVLGGDDKYMYVGEYKIENGVFSAHITVSHYGGAPWSVFGDRNQFRLVLSGHVGDRTFDAEGYIEGEPQNKILIRLTRRAELP